MNLLRPVKFQILILATLNLLIPALLLSQAVTSGTGSVRGTVRAHTTGESLIGINVFLQGTSKGAATDVDGKFQITKIASGTYSLNFSGIGFQTKTVQGIHVEEGQATVLNIEMEDESVEVHEVVVQADAIRSTEASMLSERRKSAVIGDAVSSEQIKKSPDATSSDVLRRVTGLSIVDNKFVFIRGISDRYNVATLNGASLSSTELGKKSFSFDMIPANVIENTVVIKSATPDMSGEFTGGLVQMNTVEIPDKAIQKLSLSSSINSATQDKILTMQNSGRDWLGFDDGSRKFVQDVAPSELPKVLPNNWGVRQGSAPMNSGLSLALGGRSQFGENDDFGYIGALSYKGQYQRSLISYHDDIRFVGGDATNDEYNVLLGGILNLTYKFGGHSKISFRNTFSQSGSSNVNLSQENDDYGEYQQKNYILSWIQRFNYSGTVTGDHTIGNDALKVHWRASVGNSNRNEPDRKEAVYQIVAGDPDGYKSADAHRSWGYLGDHTRGLGLDLTVPLGSSHVKFGGSSDGRWSDYTVHFFNILSPYANVGYLQQGLDSIFMPSHFGTRADSTFRMSAADRATDDFTGTQELAALYVMADIPFRFLGIESRAVGGVRFEYSDQFVKIAPGYVTGYASSLLRQDYLPSANLTFQLNPVLNIRLAAYHTVNRPEFREMSGSYIYDFTRYEGVAGNPNLVRAYVRNYDFRVEYFPGVGEVLAASYFHKNITSAIEETFVITSTRDRTWFNSDQAKNSGWEFEARKSFDFLGRYMSNFNVTANYTRIFSTVLYEGQVQGTRIITEMERPMQGQSPYIVNLSLGFTEPTFGTGVNLQYNTYGRRIDAVGGRFDIDVYEERRDLVDLTLSQPLFGVIETKFAVRNLSNKSQEFTKDGTFYRSVDRGRTYGLSVSLGL